MLILALDIATSTGWALGIPGVEPEYGSFRCKGGGIGEFLDSFERNTKLLVQTHRPGWFVFEAPIIDARKTSIEVARKLLAMAGIAEMIAWRAGIHNVREIDHSTMMKFFTGKGRWDNREQGKTVTANVCRQLGWMPSNSDEADALGCWSFMCSLVAPRAPLRRWDGALLGATS